MNSTAKRKRQRQQQLNILIVLVCCFRVFVILATFPKKRVRITLASRWMCVRWCTVRASYSLLLLLLFYWHFSLHFVSVSFYPPFIRHCVVIYIASDMTSCMYLYNTYDFDLFLHFKCHLYGFLRSWLTISWYQPTNPYSMRYKQAFACVYVWARREWVSERAFICLVLFLLHSFWLLFPIIRAHTQTHKRIVAIYTHDIFPMNLINIESRVFVSFLSYIFFPFTIFYLILLSIPTWKFLLLLHNDMKVHALFRVCACALDPCAPTHAYGQKKRAKERSVNWT